MTAQPLTREQAIDAAGAALAQISREISRERRVRSQRREPQPPPRVGVEQSDAA